MVIEFGKSVELTLFTPQVFSTTEGMGRESKELHFYHRLANLLASSYKQDWAYGSYHHFLGSLCSYLFPAEISHYVYTGQ